MCATAGSDSIAHIKAAPSHPIPVVVTNFTDCLVLLQQGDIGLAAISTDNAILAGLATQDPWTEIVGPVFTSEPYGLAISKQHPDFVRFVNAVLQQMHRRSVGRRLPPLGRHPGPSPAASAVQGLSRGDDPRSGRRRGDGRGYRA